MFSLQAFSDLKEHVENLSNRSGRGHDYGKHRCEGQPRS